MGDEPPPEYEAVPAEDTAVDAGYPRHITIATSSMAASMSRGGKNKEEFATNYISTTKYSPFTFLPVATAMQFKRGVNLYLLFIAILCCIPIISPLLPAVAVMPIAFVLTISLIREGMEDIERNKNDQELNNKVLKRYIIF